MSSRSVKSETGRKRLHKAPSCRCLLYRDLYLHLHVLLVQVAIDVQQNPFEKHRVAIMAECYMEALTLEGLPQDCTDELRLPDLPLNQTGSTAFAVRNTSDKPYRSV